MAEKDIVFITEHHEHPDGGDRGGYAEETHSFEFIGRRVVHDYTLDAGDNDPGSFGLDEGTLERLPTKEDAVKFLDNEIATLKTRLLELEMCKQKVFSAYRYEDKATYDGYEDDEE